MEKIRFIALGVRDNTYADTGELAIRASLRREQRSYETTTSNPIELEPLVNEPQVNIILGEE